MIFFQKGIPGGIWALGVVTLLVNISGVVVFSLSPLYLTEILGVSMSDLGILEGIVEGLSWLMRLISGVLSDMMHRRKPFLFVAYAFTALSRPILALATSIGGLFLARSIDRIGNGLQAPPREALVGDLAPENLKGASYGLRQSLSVLGSALGGFAVLFMALKTAEDYRLIFWGISIPPLLAIFVLMVFIKDKTDIASKKKRKAVSHKFKIDDLSFLKKDYWKVVSIGALFTLANYSGAFMILQIKSLGLSSNKVTLIMVIQNIVTMFAAYPVGRLSDSMDRRIPLAMAFIFSIVADVFFALTHSLWVGLLGVALWGLQLGISQSLLLTKVADTAPQEVRGTSFGVYYLIVGFCLFTTNFISGKLSDAFGLRSVFVMSGVLAFLALMALPFLPTQSVSKAHAEK